MGSLSLDAKEISSEHRQAAIASPSVLSGRTHVLWQSLAMPSLPHALFLLLLFSSCARSSCPECDISDRQQAARLKLQAIKQQILSKLQLQDRPNITAPLPRKVALEALRQAQGEQQGPGEPLNPGEEDAPRDDYYARTSEIIAFAEPGE